MQYGWNILIVSAIVALQNILKAPCTLSMIAFIILHCNCLVNHLSFLLDCKLRDGRSYDYLANHLIAND